MAINENIPLQGQSLDTGTPIRQANQDALNEAESTQRTLGQYYQNMDAREQSRLSSTIVGASQLKVFLDNQDLEGAENFLMQRKRNLMNRVGAGENIDTQETDAALRMLKEGNMQELTNTVDGLMAAGRVYGILDPTAGVGGATGELITRLKRENPGMSELEILQQIKGGAGTEGRNQANINSGGQANYQLQTGTNQSDLQYKPQIAGAQSQAVFEAEKAQSQPKVIASMEAALASKQAVFQKVQEAIPKVNSFTAGFFGSGAQIIPGTPAADLKADLQTIQANAGFDKLQEMRDNSPTGGALGQVSERELALLQATWSNLEQSQSPEQLQQRLQEFANQIEQSWARVTRAYELDYGSTQPGQQGQAIPMQPQINQGPQSRIRVMNPQTGEAFDIDPADLQAAQAEGFQQQ